MNRNSVDEKEWRRLNGLLDDWYNRVDVSAPAQIAFQRANPAFANWIDIELVPSLLSGEAAASHCLASIASEPDEVLRHTKFLAAYAVWEGLDAPANDISADFKSQGWTEQRLSEHLKISMIASYEVANIFHLPSSEPVH